MRHTKDAFTIVELLIVIVVIAVLAAITVVSYNGITSRAKNTTVVTATGNALNLMMLYRSQYNTWPIESQTAAYDYCFGKDFPLYTGTGSVANASPTAYEPKRACTDSSGSTRLEAAWLTDTLSEFGTVPSPTSGTFLVSNGVTLASLVYSTVPSTLRPVLRAKPGWTYSANAPVDLPTGGKGTRHYISFALNGTESTCGNIRHAQYDGQAHQGWSKCVIMLESYE